MPLRSLGAHAETFCWTLGTGGEAVQKAPGALERGAALVDASEVSRCRERICATLTGTAIRLDGQPPAVAANRDQAVPIGAEDRRPMLFQALDHIPIGMPVAFLESRRDHRERGIYGAQKRLRTGSTAAMMRHLQHVGMRYFLF